MALTSSVIEASEQPSGIIHSCTPHYRDNVDDMVCLMIIGLAFLAHLTVELL